MAVYLKALPARSGDKSAPPSQAVAEQNASLSEREPFAARQKIYDAQCAECHAAQGQGKPPDFPPLANNQSIVMRAAP